MIGRLIRLAMAFVVYGCVATVIAQAIFFSLVAGQWGLDRTRLVRMLAIAQGVDLFAIKEEADQQSGGVSQEQVSHEEVLQTRAVNVHHLQLREQALRDGLDQLMYEQRRLSDKKERYTKLRESFDAELLAMEEGAMAKGANNVRLKLESIKAKQAKTLLVQMIAADELDDVVGLLASMPIQKCAKIMSEFKTEQEIEQLNEILRKIRNGFPEFKLAAGTRKALRQPGTEIP